MHASRSLLKRHAPLVAAAAISLAVLPILQTSASAATAAKFSYSGLAYGTQVKVGSTVKSGPSAPVYLGCTTTAGINQSNTTAGIKLSPTITTGTITSNKKTFASPPESRTSATVQQANLLSGTIKASAVRAVSSTSYVNGKFVLSGAGTELLDLVIAGRNINSTPAPNTRIDLAGIGYVILNEQQKTVNALSAELTVNAMHVFVTVTNNLNVAKGTQVIVAHATSGLKGPIAGVLDGKAYGSSVTVGKTVKSGPSFLIVMPCYGTGGNVRDNTGAGVNVPDALVTGTIRNTVQGTVNATIAMGETTSTVQTANVLNGLVKASLVKADAHASSNGSSSTFSSSGSSFGTLVVAGQPQIGPDVAANTVIDLAGIGKLYLRRVIKTSNSIEVRMIELVITDSGSGLPPGTDIRVAVAHASVH